MQRVYHTFAMLTSLLIAATALAGDWIVFSNETSTRLVADPSVGENDPKEKDYIWGDVDKDGDIDLVVVRKSVGSNFGPFRNVLFMNEGLAQGHDFDGVLVDRTEEYAADADDGGQGFLDLTNDRDVVLVDVDGDTWLDIVTTVTYGQGQPKTISHPRVYINKGNDGGGKWLGFRYEEARIPTLAMVPNSPTVAAGDVTGDGMPDLYIGDYFNNLEDRLLINLGNGYFIDETNQRVAGWFTTSEFTSHAVIADLNHDGYNDLLKASSLGPYDLRAAYNDPELPGFFAQANGQIIASGSEYFVAVGDLNNDGLLDIVEANDGDDRYYLNQGNGGDGQANWLSLVFPNSANGFDNNTVIADLDNDGWKDVLIADVDVDLPSCSSRLDIHHNLGNPPFVTFQEDVGNLPTAENGPLRGTHDIAVFDIDGDCWLDLVIGNCDGTTVWINQGEGNICDTTTIIPPYDFNAFRGFYNSGDLDDLLKSDDSDLCYKPGITIFPSEAPVTLDFFGTLPNDSPSSLDVTIESSANTVGLELTFSFWNFNTSSWDVVGTATQSLNTDTVRTFPGTPADHVEPGTGEVRTRYEVRQVSFIFIFPWLDCVDQVFWTTVG